MRKLKLQKIGLSLALACGFSSAVFGQTPFYTVNGLGGTGGGTAGVAVTPALAPVGSTSLTDLGATTQFNFGTGPNGVAGESLVNAATGQAGAGVLAGTLGAFSSLNAFTVTLWVNLSAPTANNYRLLEIAPGAPATTTTADGTKFFLGLNAGGGLQAYVNNVNGNTTATDIATANTWNNAGTLGAYTPGKWYFVALTYDVTAGTSQLYSGDQSSAATLSYTFNNTAGGALDLSSATSLSLMDRFSGGRNWPGAIDDVNLYSGALNESQIDSIQLASIPEPSPFAMMSLGLCALVAVRRRSR